MTRDNLQTRPPYPRRPDPWRNARVAVAFLTVLPVMPPAAGEDAGASPGGFLHRAMAWFPVVGAAIGGAAGIGLMAAEAAGFGPGVAVAVAVAIPVALTGALHEDGLADVADGLGGGWSRDDKLRILRDSRIGAYGVVTLILAFAGRFAGLSDVGDPAIAAIVLIVAASLSRAFLPVVAHVLPPARSDGLAAAAGRPGRGPVAIAFGSAVLLTGLLLPPLPAIAAVAAAGVAAAIVAAIAWRQIGGHTGDVLGAVQVAADVAVILVLSALS